MSGSRSKSIVLWTLVTIALVTLSAPTIVVLGASFTGGNII
ncbi:MAG: ABC transporter permease, partial [Mesorhizobium sp.]